MQYDSRGKGSSGCMLNIQETLNVIKGLEFLKSTETDTQTGWVGWNVLNMAETRQLDGI